ncbi:MAG: fumarylacetoacetate hydrolase family protein [Ilumatobacter sp.]|uniref:2-keto-4-pentenoate hydratase n=1 Tax=Ilumatobacter sp. TaxID=1967498 RepID=UPI003C7266F8
MTTEITDAQIEAVARQLVESAETRIPVEALGIEPGDVATGYRIQEAGHGMHDAQLIGWKAGCTTAVAQKFLDVDGPVAGRYRSDHVLAAPAQIAAAEFATPPHLEVEVGLRLLVDIDSAPLDAMQLADAVEAFAAIEVVASRLAAFPMVSGPLLVADNVAGARMVVGPTLDLDAAGVRSLDTTPVTLTIDGDEVAAGSGADALGHPLKVLAWLAGHAAERGTPLRSGELVITGTCTGLVAARPGARHVGRVGDTDVSLAVR